MYCTGVFGIENALLNLNAMQPRFDRGHTGHEHMCGFGLINMNGRLYDPYLQRFLSPDPYIISPGNAQDYNRYSYVLNNPLIYTDPSGFARIGGGGSGSGARGISGWGYGYGRGLEMIVRAQPCTDPMPFPAGGAVWNTMNWGAMSLQSQGQRGPGWEPFVGTAGGLGAEMYYSKTFGTWMGKNFKMYQQTWGGNKTAGGKLKFGKKVSTGIKFGGYGLGIWNAYKIDQQNRAG